MRSATQGANSPSTAQCWKARISATAVSRWSCQLKPRMTVSRQSFFPIRCPDWVGMMSSSTAGPVTRQRPPQPTGVKRWPVGDRLTAERSPEGQSTSGFGLRRLSAAEHDRQHPVWTRRSIGPLSGWPGLPVRPGTTQQPLEAATSTQLPGRQTLPTSDFCLVGDLKSVIDLDAAVPPIPSLGTRKSRLLLARRRPRCCSGQVDSPEWTRSA